MGLFSFFNKKNVQSNGIDSSRNLPEIPEDVFLENQKPSDTYSGDNNGLPNANNGINLLFQFLEKNYESKGYDDALVNPDNTHLDENVKALKNDLERTFRKVKTFYIDFIKEIDFHIASRSRTGMVDTVEELTVRKEIAESHIKQVLEIEQEAANNKGVGQGIVLSYTRGFRNGLAAISHHSILRKNF
jgi:hypothetical protein